MLAPPLLLPLLAGLTPADVEVRLVDENVEPVDTDADTDWVAITCMTASAPRRLRHRGRLPRPEYPRRHGRHPPHGEAGRGRLAMPTQ